MTKFRIAMVAACPYPVPQGSQALLHDAALVLTARGHDVRLVVYGYGQGKDRGDLPVHRCARIPFARKTAAGPSLAKPLLDLALVAALRRVVREQRVDIVHAHNYEGLLVALASRARPIVYHAHNAMADELPYYVGGAGCAAAFGRWLDRTFPKRADVVIAPHAALAEYLVGCGCRPERVQIVPPVAPVDTVQPAKPCEGVPPVLYMGNLDNYQNLPLLETAMARVLSVRPDTQFRIATNASADTFPMAERVSVPSFDALRNVLAEEAVVVVPRVSWSGYPIKLLNAFAAGQAVVACRSSAHGMRHEVNGLVVDDDDSESLAAAILRLLNEPAFRRSLGQAARRTALEFHAPAVIAERLEQIYELVLTT